MKHTSEGQAAETGTDDRDWSIHNLGHKWNTVPDTSTNYWNIVPRTLDSGMKKTASGPQRRENPLSRERITEAAIELLDHSGEGGLTFRALSERLATGAGAIYWHIANRSDLLTAACDAMVARTLKANAIGATPAATIRGIALGMFDAIDGHPWLGSALIHSAGQLPMVRVFESIGHQVRELGVPNEEQWGVACALLNYILGVGGQNAANTQFAKARNLDRSHFLDAVSTMWSQLNPDEYPFAHSVAGHLRVHDDRNDFLTGIDLILKGAESPRQLRPALHESGNS
nr:TetR/AcrR family transcriptional regulator [Haloferula sp. BvORR071]